MKNKKDKPRKSVYFGFIERECQYIGNGTDKSIWYYRLSTERHIHTSYIVRVEFIDGSYEFETRNSIYRVGLMIMPKGTDMIKELKNYLKGEDFKRFLDFNSNILGEE